MDALRPFSRREVASMGGADAFLPAAWQTALVSRDRNVWAIPWYADTRVIYYWRDLLDRAGVDEETAFLTPEHVEETLARLRASGATPWAVPTHSQFLTLHNVASWVWGAGEELVSDDGKRVLFNQPGARSSIRAYFALHRYLPPSTRKLSNPDAFHLFVSRQVAATIGPSGWLPTIRESISARGEQLPLAVALPPGPSYVGGSNLVVWKHTIHAQRAVELVRFLTQEDTQRDLCAGTGLLPVHRHTLSLPLYSTDPLDRLVIEALESGRSYPTFPRWGLIEERTSSTFVHIWDDLLAEPDPDLDGVLDRHLAPLARRLDLALGAPR
jgi:multiple sugar transport system substrate-binding protein